MAMAGASKAINDLRKHLWCRVPGARVGQRRGEKYAGEVTAKCREAPGACYTSSECLRSATAQRASSGWPTSCSSTRKG